MKKQIKKENKTKKKRKFLEEKQKRKKMEKQNMWGKLMINYQLAQYWKNKFDKDNLKKTCEETL